MAKKLKFKCSKFDRRFSMAAHLARHMSTIHGSKKTKATKKKRKRAVAKKNWASVATRVKRGAESDLGGVLDSLKAHRNQLAAQRNDIETQIQGIDDALAALGTGAGAKRAGTRRRRGKGPRAGSLKDYISRVLRGRSKGMSVKDITAAVLKAGFKTRNKTLDNSVSNTLVEMKNVAKVARGIYRLK